jgi:sRNA-binding carbon storage regulator CsrA
VALSGIYQGLCKRPGNHYAAGIHGTVFMMNRMKAFEIRINDATPMIVAADNHVIADFTYGVSAINPNSAVIAGFDDFYRYVWLDEEIHHNDEVHIRVVEVDKEKISVPLKTTKESLERLKEEYDKLQQELKVKGII